MGTTTQEQHRTDAWRDKRAVVADPSPRSREELRHLLHEMGLEIAGLAGDGQEAVQIARRLAPDFIFLDDALPLISAAEAAYAIHAGAPTVAPILLSPRSDAAFLREAMHSGVRDVLPKSPGADAVRASLERLHAASRHVESEDFDRLLDPDRLPLVLCVTGGKGGVGKTMVASNLALLLQERFGDTALVDLYTQFGDVGTVLNVKPRRTLVELSATPDDIDSSLLSAYAVPHPSGLKVFIGSDEPRTIDAISVAAMDRILFTLKRDFRYIVCDAPPYLHATTVHALSIANAVVLVCNLFDYTTIADTKQLFDTLAGAYVARDRLKIVVNRVTEQNRFKTEDVEETFGEPVFARIPNDSNVVSLLNSGTTTYAAIEGTELAAGFAKLADGLLDQWQGAIRPVPARRTVDSNGAAPSGWRSMLGRRSRKPSR